jgi:putative sugar O-methyltransferase
LENERFVSDPVQSGLKTSPTLNPFWRALGTRHAALLESYGYERFKRTVNQQYFNWGVLGILRFQFMAVFWAWVRQPDPLVFASRLDAASPANTTFFHPRGPGALIYRLHVAMLASVLRRNDPERLLHRFEEPAIGDPVRVRYDGVALSQDLCNAVHEYYRVVEHLPEGSSPTILEIGAGYGRLAYVFLRARPNTRYVIVDVPPARDLAAWYLSVCFPDVRIFHCREGASQEELREALTRAQVVFLAPHQFDAVPSKTFDAAVSISSLHEMSLPEIGDYFAAIDRVTRGIFYTKQWRVSTVPPNGTVMREAEYPVPATWTRLYQRRHPLLPRFFEACFVVK